MKTIRMAIVALKRGECVARKGWNWKDWEIVNPIPYKDEVYIR